MGQPPPSAGDDLAPPHGFIIGAVTGVNPGRWVQEWNQRFPEQRATVVVVDASEQRAALLEGTVSMCFVRGFDSGDGGGFHLVPLFEETQVLAVSRDHVLADWPEVGVDDVRDEALLQHPSSIPGWSGTSTTALIDSALDVPLPDRLRLVAEGVGVLVLPMSVARLHSRRDVVAVPIIDLATIPVGLAWLRAEDPDRAQEFVGVVRGRTANTSRGRAPRGSSKRPAEPRSGVRKGRRRG